MDFKYHSIDISRTDSYSGNSGYNNMTDLYSFKNPPTPEIELHNSKSK